MANINDELLESLLREVNSGDEEVQKLLSMMAEENNIIPEDLGNEDSKSNEDPIEKIEVIVYCTDRQNQNSVYNDLKKEGYKCKKNG